MPLARDTLIGKVAAAYLTEQMRRETDGVLRFCIVNLNTGLVTAIANVVLSSPPLREQFEVRIPKELASPGGLPTEVISDEASAHWRHTLPADPSKRCMLFAVPESEKDQIGATINDLTKIDSGQLRELRGAWLHEAGLTPDIFGDKLKIAEAALAGLEASDLVVPIEQLADYVLAVAQSVLVGRKDIIDALDWSLPSLHLPCLAGQFSTIPEKQRTRTSTWRTKFNRIYKDLRLYLYKVSPKENEVIPTEDLRDAYQKHQTDLEPSEKQVVEAFLKARVVPGGWTREQSALAAIEWKKVEPILKTQSLKQVENLWLRTKRHFDNEHPDKLSTDDEEFLERSGAKPRREANEDDKKFFDSHSYDISENKRLFADWDDFVYGPQKEHDNLLVGIISTLERLLIQAGDAAGPRTLVVRVQDGKRVSFWGGKNWRVVSYLAYCVHGLKRLFGSSVTFEFGRLLDNYLNVETTSKLRDADRASKDATQIPFEVELRVGSTALKSKFIWRMAATAIGTSLHDDLHRLANSAGERAWVPASVVYRREVNEKGVLQRLTISDCGTFRDAEAGDEGRLVPSPDEATDLLLAFERELHRQTSENILAKDRADKVLSALTRFVDRYTEALRSWTTNTKEGIASPAFLEQAEAYGEFLSTLRDAANVGTSLRELWPLALKIGITRVTGTPASAIVAPWHPFRLAQIQIKAKQAAEVVDKLLKSDSNALSKASLFFADKALELSSPYYPEVCLGERDKEPRLLVVSESSGEYSLAKPPLAEVNDHDGGDASAALAAQRLGEVCNQYLTLFPHERANFSVLLYDAEATELPRATADELAGLLDEDEALLCDLFLSHTDSSLERRMYGEQNAAVNDDAGAGYISEAARNFMSRLRVGFLDPNETLQSDLARQLDIVFLQDVIARNAEVRWLLAPYQDAADALSNVPPTWPRRKPQSRGDDCSTVYLAAPHQPSWGTAYLDALYGAVTRDTLEQGRSYVPARVVNFGNASVERVFQRTHALGTWVVNLDPIVDRRLLQDVGIKVIRYVHDRSISRNVVISTTTSQELLATLVVRRLRGLNNSWSDEKCDKAARSFVERAGRISGQIVLRASRHGVFANELLGVVLSAHLVARQLNAPGDQIGWFFLDDYAEWFGQAEESIADLMAIAPTVEDGRPVVRLVLSESKFVGKSVRDALAKKSAQQLGETASRLNRALEQSVNRVDRAAWLSRIADMMLDGMSPFGEALPYGWDVADWAKAVREDKVDFELVGFSHVFVYDEDKAEISRKTLPKAQYCSQIEIPAPAIRELVEDFCGWRDLGASSREEVWQSAVRSRAVGPVSPGQQPAEAFREQQAEAPREPLLTAGIAPAPGHSTSPQDKQESLAAPPKSPEAPGPALAGWVQQHVEVHSAVEADNRWLEDTVNTMKRALTGYRLRAQVTQSPRLTPNAALIRFRGSDDMTVALVEKRRTELLTSHGLDVVSVQAGPGEVIISVARPHREVLSLAETWARRQTNPAEDGTNLSFVLGTKEVDGELLYLNLGSDFGGQPRHAPHSLVAGTTGSGKSVLVQNLLLDICATNSPEQARIYMIDPKMGLDYTWLPRLPHLQGEVITNKDNALETISSLVGEMERRYKVLAAAKAPNLSAYNRGAKGEMLPVIFLVHDEFADWMVVEEYQKAVQGAVSRLGVKARAAGIHLIFVAQRPDNLVFPMQLRANLGNRLVLKVADVGTSEIALGQKGAERLLGKGHLAAKLEGEQDVTFAQVPFLAAAQIEDLVRVLSSRESYASS